MKSLDYCLALGFIAVVGPLAGYSVGVDEVRSDKPYSSASLPAEPTMGVSSQSITHAAFFYGPQNQPPPPIATHGYMVASGVGPNGKPAEIKVNKFGYVLCVGP